MIVSASAMALAVLIVLVSAPAPPALPGQLPVNQS